MGGCRRTVVPNSTRLGSGRIRSRGLMMTASMRTYFGMAIGAMSSTDTATGRENPLLMISTAAGTASM